MCCRVPPIRSLRKAFTLHKIPGLDLYNPEHLFKVEKLRDLSSPLNQFEFLSMCSGGFPEPFTFGIPRPPSSEKAPGNGYDIVHDNQSLSYGLLGIAAAGYPTVATIHHPITVDRDTEIEAAGSWLRRLKVRRWYSFLAMQKRVSRRLSEDHHRLRMFANGTSAGNSRLPLQRFRVVPNGINTDFFYPLDGRQTGGQSDSW